MDVQTKAFHEEPFKNVNEKVRKDFCRTDHADDVMYVWGLPFEPTFKLPHGRYFSEEEENLSKRVMKGFLEVEISAKLNTKF